MVIACGLSEKTLVTLSSVCWQDNIPLVASRSMGFLGYLRLQIKEHVVVESHPDNLVPDLRLDQPWPALTSWLDSQAQAMEDMSLKDHGHTPYPVIMHKALKVWREEHGGNFPANFREKKELKAKIQILGAMRKKEDGEEAYEENFEEAGRAVNTVASPTTIPAPVKEIIEDPEAENVSGESSSFWIMAHSLKEFVMKENRLPVSGVIPDMFSDSERFIQLQNIYRDKAAQDAEQVGRNVTQALESLGRSAETIQEPEVRRFCKESRNLRVQRGSSLSEEFSQPGRGDWCDPDMGSDRLYYLVLRAVDRYVTQYGGNPGLTEADIEVDVGRLKTIAGSMLSSMGHPNAPQGIDEHLHEVCRYGGAELHSVSSFLGGTAAQECIKILTGQFVPIHNTVLYNAVTSDICHFTV